MDLPKQEEQILRYWKQIRAFENSVNKRPKSRSFVFYEGPPTANGQPGIHHVLSRAFKDIVLRYKTMQGYRVERKAGWDTHGLPVEVEVEKELGLHNKKDIEKYGVAKFNKKCRESVWRYKQDWDNLTERMGFWIDLENPYITYDPLYMETLWWIIKQAHNKKLLYEGYRVAPYCPRCGTSLSSHEVGQGYEDVTEDSVFVKFKIKNPKKHNLKPNTYFLAWTTTPWTLPGNVALAVGAKIDYVLVKQGKEHHILAKDRLSILEGEYKVVKEFKGKELEGMEYRPLYDSLSGAKEKKHYVALADFVSTEEGTGIVHTAVMYGEDDYNLGQELDLPKIHTVDESGKFNKLVPQWQGKFVKDVEPEIILDLKKRNLLYKKEKYTHSYPFCWRCKTPLLYYAMQSWFIKMSSLRNKLIKNNGKVNWMPAHIKDGRFGEWLRELKDWNFSRSRYWGTPLPVWKCTDCHNIEVIGSREDLKAQKFSTNRFFYIRHGESEKNNRENPIMSSRWPETKKYHLTKKGIDQVKRTSKQIQKMGGVDLIFASDFTRTKETAEIVAKSLGIRVQYDKRLREYDTGIYDGRGIREFHKDFSNLKERFRNKPPEGETSANLQRRMFDFASSINSKYKDKKILIVSHGDPLWLLESRMSGLTIDEAVDLKKGNIEDYPKRAVLREFVFRNFPYNSDGELDFHKPFVDEIIFECQKCDKESGMRRVEDLVDVWFDSGSMPFASATAKATVDKQGRIKAPVPFPADYITEGVDMTRGWFYSLLAVATMLGLESPYKNVISLGHILDKQGKKMSKSKGNVVNPWGMIEKYGADSVRWYFYTLNQPWDYKNFDEPDLQKSYRKFVSTLANTLEFHKIYRSSRSNKPYKTYNFLDKWILSRLNSVILDVTKRLDGYDITGAARSIEAFVIDDVSNWYVRRSRKRFQTPQASKDKEAAESMLAHVLLETSKLSAPFIPFLSEEVFRETRNKEQGATVHWENFPKANKRYINKALEDKMASARKVVEIAHEIRAASGIRVRQPLSRIRVDVKMPVQLHAIVGEEVNVKSAGYRTSSVKGWETKKEGGISVSLDTTLTPALLEEGFVNEFIRNVQELRRAGGFMPKDKIELRYKTEGKLNDMLSRSVQQIEKQNNAKIVAGGAKKETFRAKKEFSWENKKVWVGIKKL